MSEGKGWKVFSGDRNELFPVGKRYLAHAVGVKPELTGRGNDQVSVLLHFDDPDFEGWEMDWHGWFTDKAWKLTRNAFKEMGWDGESDWSEPGADIPTILPTQIFAVVDHEEAQDKEGKTTGKWRARILFINSTKSRAGLGKPMSEEQRGAFFVTMKQRWAEAEAGEAQELALEDDPSKTDADGAPLSF